MPLTRRIVKGVPLTGAEHDGNLDFFVAGLAGKADATDPRLTDARAPTAHTHTTGETWLATLLGGKANSTELAALAAVVEGKAADTDARFTNARPIADGNYGLFTVTAGAASINSSAAVSVLTALMADGGPANLPDYIAHFLAAWRALGSATYPSLWVSTGEGALGGEFRSPDEMDPATKEQIWARATGNKVVTIQAWAEAIRPVAISASGTLALNLNAGINFDITVTGALTIDLPTNLDASKEGVIRLFGTGAHAITFGASSSLLNKASVTFLTGAGAENHVWYRCRDSSQVEFGPMWSKAA